MSRWLCILLIASALEPSLADEPASSRLDVLRTAPGDAGFALALEPRAFEFPKDHGPHPNYRYEWWYLTGRLRAADAEQFGFELTFFRLALAPPETQAAARPSALQSASSAWRARQIYVAHFALTDVTRGRFYSQARYARDALGLAGAEAAPFHVWLGPWSLSESPTEGSRATDGSDSPPLSWTLRAASETHTLVLNLKSMQPPVLNGERGLSVKASTPGAASYYYSIPRLALSGELTSGGRPLPVSGIAWLDREWGSGALGSEEVGWDWFSLQLADGSAFMFYALRDRNGARDPHSAGTWIAADGTAHALSDADVRIEVERRWRSPRGGDYPSRWRVRVPSVGLDARIRPVLADQELDTTPRYWEGAVDAQGERNGRPLLGEGYVELVGYAHPPR